MKDKIKILIADPDTDYAKDLTAAFPKEQFTVYTVQDGDSALKAFHSLTPDFLITEAVLPRLSGIDLVKEIRQHNALTPIFFLTSKTDPVDRILGLELGGTDYISKSSLPREVFARVKSLWNLLTAWKSPQDLRVVRYPGLEISMDNYEVQVQGQLIDMTPKELEILYLLASNPGQVFDRESILTAVWGADYYGDSRTVDTHIKRIRKKIRTPAAEYGILTVYGIGYKFEGTPLP